MRRGRLSRGRGREPRRPRPRRPARARLGRAAAADRDREADPGRRGPRRRLRRRRRRPPPGRGPDRPRGRSSSVSPASKKRTRPRESYRPPGDRRATGRRRPLAAPAGACAGPGRGGEGRAAPAPAEHAALLLPSGGGLSTKEVFDEADRLGLGREESDLDAIAADLRAAAGAGASPLAYAHLLVNDLEPAASSLRPDIGDALDALRGTKAGAVFLSGSGPTAVGLFPSLSAAERAASELDRPDAIVCLAGSEAGAR